MGRLRPYSLARVGARIADVLIETGTCSGGGPRYCASHFPRIHTVERDKQKFQRAQQWLKRFPNVRCHLGESPVVLPQIIDYTRRTLFWLDAHYVASDETQPAVHVAEQCPLLKELAVIFDTPWRVKPQILIDDGKMYGEQFWKTPYAIGYDKSQWPRLIEIERLAWERNYMLRISHDTLILETQL